MRRIAVITIIIVLGVLPLITRLSAQSVKPRLVVLLVVDQMRADYIDRFQNEWTGGLHRLVRNGAWFRRAAYPFLSTVTCAGHATISTGANPHVHGVIENAWWDRERQTTTTCTGDPRTANMGYGVSTKTGDSSYRLEVPTFADEMRAQVSAHVVTLALKERSAIMLAGHGGDAVTWLSNNSDGWVTSSAFTETLVPAVLAFAESHPISADVGKTWDRLLPLSRYHTPDDGPGETPPKGWRKTFPHALSGSGGLADADFYHQWELSPFADAYIGEMAATLTEQMQLGRHGTTDVLGVSFSTPDLVGHAFGPDSQEAEDILVHLDRTIGALLTRLDAAVGTNNYMVALTADHGVTRIPEQLNAAHLEGGRVIAEPVVAAIDRELGAAWGPGKYVAQWIGNEFYFQPGVYERLRGNPKLLNAIKHRISDAPGVQRVFAREELRGGALSKDQPLRTAALSYFEARSGDFVVALRPGWIAGNLAASHGSGNPDDQRVPVVLMGPWFRPGMYDDAITPADIAPTLAHICGLKLPQAEGHPLLKAIIVPREIPSSVP